MRVRHPRAHPDVPGKPPAKIDTPDGLRTLDDDGTFGQGKDFARWLAGRYDVPFAVVNAKESLESVDLSDGADGDVSDSGEAATDGSDESEDAEDAPTAAEQIDAGVCPWCGEEYDGVAQHASAAHPDEWAEYKED